MQSVANFVQVIDRYGCPRSLNAELPGRGLSLITLIFNILSARCAGRGNLRPIKTKIMPVGSVDENLTL